MKPILLFFLKMCSVILRAFIRKIFRRHVYLPYWVSWSEIEAYAPENKHPEILSSWYTSRTGKKLDLNNPRSFNEKINWLKLNDSTPQKTRLADKLLVRDWIREKAGEEYLIPLCEPGVYDSFDDIDFDKLPHRFVLKANHGSRMNYIVKDKSKLNKEKAKKMIGSWMNTNYAFAGSGGLELHYRDIPPKIIAEKYMENRDKKSIFDYKFFCFNGRPLQVWVNAFSGTGKTLQDTYDINWNKLGFRCIWPSSKGLMAEKPKKFEEMVELARKLSQSFYFVRVDLYSINDTVYFGEMSFTPDAGAGKFIPDEWDLKLGDMLRLPIDKIEKD